MRTVCMRYDGEVFECMCTPIQYMLSMIPGESSSSTDRKLIPFGSSWAKSQRPLKRSGKSYQPVGGAHVKVETDRQWEAQPKPDSSPHARVSATRGTNFQDLETVERIAEGIVMTNRVAERERG
jgi:hypothetical protein